MLFKKIHIGWINGYKSPKEEFEKIHSKYPMHSEKEYNELIKALKDFPSDYEGFIDNDYFPGRSNVARMTSFLPKFERDKEELIDAIDYVKVLPITTNVTELIDLYNGVSGEKISLYYLFSMFFIELLVRNRNVDLLLSESMTSRSMVLLSDVIKVKNIDKVMMEYLEDTEGVENMYVDNEVLYIRFNPKGCSHKDISFPIL